MVHEKILKYENMQRYVYKTTKYVSKTNANDRRTKNKAIITTS